MMAPDRAAAAAAAALSLPSRPPSLSSPNGPAPYNDNAAAADDLDDLDDLDDDVAGLTAPWVRPSATGARRLSSRPYTAHRGASSYRGAILGAAGQAVRAGTTVAGKAWVLFRRLSPVQRAAVVAGLGLLVGLSVVAVVFNHRIFAALGPLAKSWRALPGGWLILFALTCATAFPPMVGYSSLCTISGLVYGFPLGWPIVAAASTLGSLAAFLASRTVMSGYVDRLVGKDHRFVAFGQVLRRDGLGVLTAIRVCPLPFSLSNGFLATIPSIRPWAFAASTAMARYASCSSFSVLFSLFSLFSPPLWENKRKWGAEANPALQISPKLAVHVFIGSRLGLLAEKGDEMTTGDKAINWASMIVFSSLGLGVSLLIYRRTMARAAELLRGEGATAEDAEEGIAAGAGGDYADLEEGVVDGGDGGPLMDPADADAALMDDDDISLWDHDGSRDSWGDEGEGEGGGRAR